MKSIGKRSRELNPGYANHPSILKKLAIVGIAAGAAFNTTACSAESEPSQPVAVATTAEDVIPSKDKLSPGERQRAKEIVLPEVLRRLDHFEGLIATSSNDPSLKGLILRGSDKDVLHFTNNLLPRDDQDTGVWWSDSLRFHIDHGNGTTLRVYDETNKYCIQSEDPRCADENPLQGTWFEFSTPKSYLSNTKDLTSGQVRDILNDPKLQLVWVANHDGAIESSVGIDFNGTLKGYNSLHIKNEDDDKTFTSDDNPYELLERLINKYRDGLGR